MAGSAKIAIASSGTLFTNWQSVGGIRIDETERPLISVALVARETRRGEIGRHRSAERGTLGSPIASGAHHFHSVCTVLEQPAR